MIRLSPAQEQAFSRVVRAEAMHDIEAIFTSERERWLLQYEQARETLVVSGTGRDMALQLRGRIMMLNDIISMLERQKV